MEHTSLIVQLPDADVYLAGASTRIKLGLRILAVCVLECMRMRARMCAQSGVQTCEVERTRSHQALFCGLDLRCVFHDVLFIRPQSSSERVIGLPCATLSCVKKYFPVDYCSSK